MGAFYGIICASVAIDNPGFVCYDSKRQVLAEIQYAGMAELVDAQDLGSCAVRCAGSIPVTRTSGKSPQT